MPRSQVRRTPLRRTAIRRDGTVSAIACVHEGAPVASITTAPVARIPRGGSTTRICARGSTTRICARGSTIGIPKGSVIASIVARDCVRCIGRSTALP